MGLVDIPNLEIVAAGVEYDISTGKVSFTMEDLADAVKAANEDPAIKAPRLKLGHESVLNKAAGLDRDDGQPSLGTVQNMRLNEHGNVIIGDYKGVPEWLAAIMPSAYPSRSFEGGYNYKSNGTDRTYRMVIKAVALLGVRWPGCATIDDIQTLYGSSLPDGVEITASEGGVQTVSFAIAASVNVDDVRRQFYSDGPGGESDDFLWVQAIYVDPYEIIVMNEDEDQLERYSYECSPDGEVTFGEGQPVIVQYVPDPLAAGERMKMIACAGQNVAIYASRSESRPEDNQDPQGGQKMTPEELRQSIGLPAEATDEQVRAKLAELQGSQTAGDKKPAAEDKPADANVEPTVEPSQQNVDKGGEAVPSAGNGGGQPPASGGNAPDAGTGPGATGPGVQASDGTVTVPAEVWAQIQAGAQQGATVYAAEMDRDKKETIEKACEAGKIAAAMKGQMETLWDKDPKGTKHLLTAPVEQGGLAENLVPVQARGVTPGGDDMAAAESDYPTEWLAPTEQARIAAASAGAAPGTTTSAGRD